MPTVLSYLNVSNASNLLADSGFVFQESLLRELRALGWETVLVGPPGIERVSTSRTVTIPMPQSKYGVRYSLPWDDLDAALDAVPGEPDVLLVNQPELAVPLAALVSRRVGRRIPMAAYFHYIPIEAASAGGTVFDPSLDDDGMADSVWTRQVEAARYADVAMIGSEWGRDLFLRASRDRERLADRVAVVPPPRTAGVDALAECPQPSADGDRQDVRPVRILYNHRLYAHYGTTAVLDAIDELERRRPGRFRFVVTNPTGERSPERRRLDPSIDLALARIRAMPGTEIVDAPDRASYEAVLARTDIVLAPLRPNPLWNMSIVDAMAHGAPAVALCRGAFPEIVGDPDLLFETPDELVEILTRLVDDRTGREAAGHRARARTERWAPAAIGRRVSDLLHGAIRDRCG